MGAIRKVVRVGGLGALAAAGAWLLRRRQAVRAVAPELRSPALYLPLSLDNPVALAVGRRIGSTPSPIRPGVEVRRQRAQVPGAVPVVVLSYLPTHRTEPSAALLWIHGGGTILGAPERDHDWCSRIADELGVVVFNVDYRLAPENPFPAGLDDCFTALRWLHAEATALGIAPGRIAVGGASAGGGLAAALAQRAADENVPVAFQLLLFPMLDDRTVLRREHDGRGTFLWTPRANRFAWTCYLGHPPRPEEPPAYAAPARRIDLTGLPSAWIGVGDLDLFHDEVVDYAHRLRRAGIECDLLVEPGMYHAGGLDHAESAPSVARLRDSAKAALRSALGPAHVSVDGQQ
jgi:acetyl esterase/lipase